MPLVHIHLLEGRTDEQKRAAIQKVTAALHDALGAPPETIRIWFTDIPKTDFGIGGRTAKELGR
ncbi:MAG: 2-hydroxymuconate tautomerase [Betaproteobacteria bacterium]|jgi:4-oxalocrotonate tautomerase